MIVFFETGRLGNQLFQYAAMKALFPNDRLVFFGCAELKQALAKVDAIILEKGKLPRLLMFGLRVLLPALARLRIIGSIYEIRVNTSYKITAKRGFLNPLFLLHPSYFQHKRIFELFPAFELSRELVQVASDWLEKTTQVKPNALACRVSLVFVHIRRGDYLHWPSRELPAVLDKGWYSRAMDNIRSIVPNPMFVVITDDFYYAKDVFGNEPDIIISRNDQFVDLALMSQCSHGILSASSFAWWGAWLSRQNTRESGVYLAPKCWAGHRSGEWYPKGFVTDWITYVE